MTDLLFDKINAVTPLSAESFAYFKNLFIHKKLRKRQYLHQDGDVCKYQAFVLKGLLRSYTVDEKGSEHILQFASEGWWISDLSSYLTGELSSLNIDAVEDAELLLLTRSSWEQAMEKIPALEHYFRIIIQNHLVATQKRLLLSLSETAEVKYKRFIEAYPESAQRLPQHMVASYVGVSRETLSRIRNQRTDP